MSQDVRGCQGSSAGTTFSRENLASNAIQLHEKAIADIDIE
jgi:hypothetical protein